MTMATQDTTIFNRPPRRRRSSPFLEVDEAIEGVPIPEDLFIDKTKIMPDLEMMVAGGKVYSVDPIGVKVQGIIDHLKGFYNAKYRELKGIEEEREFQVAMTQWNKQLDSIYRSRNRGTIVVPPDMTGTPIMVFAGTLCFLRYERFFPDEITGPASYFRSRAENTGASAKKIFDFVKDMPNDKKILMKIKQDKIDIPSVAFVYSPQHNLIYNPWNRLYHTMSSKKLCIGETNAREFWDSPIFNKMINRINIYSPATDTMKVMINGSEKAITMWSLMIDKYMVEIKKVEDEAWRV